jgi:hypothetical protein
MRYIRVDEQTNKTCPGEFAVTDLEQMRIQNPVLYNAFKELLMKSHAAAGENFFKYTQIVGKAN